MQINQLTAQQRTLIIILLLLFCAVIAVRIGHYVLDNEFPLGYDARSYIAAGYALRLEFSPFSDTTWERIQIEEKFSKYLYTPLLAFLIIPVSSLSIIPLSYVFVGIAALSAFVFAALMMWNLDWRLALLAVFLFPPTWQTIYLGQINYIIACLLLLSIYAIIRDYQYRLGIYLAFASILKLTPLVSSVTVFMRGYRRSLLAWGVTILSIVLVTLPWIDVTIWLESTHFALRQVWVFPRMLSWPGILAFYIPRYGEVIALILVIVMTIYTFLRIRKIPILLAFSASILLPLLVARITWEHHAVMALPALYILWDRSRNSRVIAVLAWLAIAMIGGVMVPISLTICWFISLWPEHCPDFQGRVPRAIQERLWDNF